MRNVWFQLKKVVLIIRIITGLLNIVAGLDDEFEGEIRRTSLSPPKSVTSTGAEAANVAAAGP